MTRNHFITSVLSGLIISLAYFSFVIPNPFEYFGISGISAMVIVFIVVAYTLVNVGKAVMGGEKNRILLFSFYMALCITAVFIDSDMQPGDVTPLSFFFWVIMPCSVLYFVSIGGNKLLKALRTA